MGGQLTVLMPPSYHRGYCSAFNYHCHCEDPTLLPEHSLSVVFKPWQALELSSGLCLLYHTDCSKRRGQHKGLSSSQVQVETTCSSFTAHPSPPQSCGHEKRRGSLSESPGRSVLAAARPPSARLFTRFCQQVPNRV